MLRKYTYLFLIAFLLVVMMGTAHAEPLPENSVYEEDYVAADLQMTGIFDRKSAELKLCGDTFIAELPDSEECIHTIKAEVVFVYKAGDNYVCVIENVSSTAGEGSKIVVRKPGAVAVYATVTFSRDSLHSKYEIGDVGYKNKALRRKYENSNYCKYEVDKLVKTVTITGYVGEAENITIPASIEGYPVVKIGDKAFQNNNTIKNVQLPNGVTAIGRLSFESCDELSNINLLEGIKEIGANAFRGCSKLTGVVLPATLTRLENGTFEGCDSITELHIPAGVNHIGVTALACKNLTSLTVEEGNEEYYSVDNCIITDADNWGMTLLAACRGFEIPEGIECMMGSFCGCDWLTKITIPDSVTWIGPYAFSGCENLKEIELPEKLTKIGFHAFENTGFTEFEIPKTVIEIESGAFIGMHIKEIIVPENITTISNNLFSDCKQLERVVFLGDVAEIGMRAFSGCENLRTIELSDKITAIASGMFNGCKSLTNITIPKGVKEIGGAAFSGCENLKTIELPDGIEIIEQSMFSNCKNLKKIVIPKGVKKIERWTFWDCTNLKELYIPPTVTEIGDEVFIGIEKTVVIYGEVGSYAEKFAKDNGIAFVPTDYYNSVQ